MKAQLLRELIEVARPLGACGLPVMLDAEQDNSAATWQIVRSREGQARGVLKAISVSGLRLIFYAEAYSGAHELDEVLSEMLSGCVRGRVFYPTACSDVFEGALRRSALCIERRILLDIYNLRRIELRKYKNVAGEVRKLHNADLGQASRLYTLDTKNVFSTSHFAGHDYFGLFIRDELVGACCLYGTSQLMSSALIGGFLTVPFHRGKGVAKCLGSHVCEVVFQRVDNVSLHVERDNEPAHRTFQALGFDKAGTLEEVVFSSHEATK